jgi:hypothetical protein
VSGEVLESVESVFQVSLFTPALRRCWVVAFDADVVIRRGVVFSFVGRAGGIVDRDLRSEGQGRGNDGIVWVV